MKIKECEPTNDQCIPIDIVITWVDGSDSAWLDEKKKYQPESSISTDDSSRRYRDWGTLRYVFRGIEKYAPWVRRVFLVTWGHIPEWLNLDAPKLRVVKHKDYIPTEYLPTFSSHPIELNMHKIPDLSEHFIYFNDDMFITQPIKQSLFFRDGLPVLPPQLHAVLPRGDTGVMAHVFVNNMSAINRHFDFHDSLKANMRNWFDPVRVGIKVTIENTYCWSYSEFPGIRHLHLPSPMRMSTMKDVWDKETILLDATCRHRFRSAEDVSPYIFWQWELAAGTFVPCRAKTLGRRFTADAGSVSTIVEAIEQQTYPLICVNDMGTNDYNEFLDVSAMIRAAFENAFPMKSGFEK